MTNAFWAQCGGATNALWGQKNRSPKGPVGFYIHQQFGFSYRVPESEIMKSSQPMPPQALPEE